eukprot:Rhum_TRINITY_DN8406_c0_g1::Rhum_TRINITY_DN8406_c0_g1_i1::g.27694::m.27694
MEVERRLVSACRDGWFEAALEAADDLSPGTALCDVTDAERGWALLHWAAWGGCRTLVAWLVERGCCVDAEAEEGVTPLLVACGRGHAKVVDLLLGHSRACVNVCDLSGTYPLHSAASAGHAGCVAALVRAGAAPGVRNGAGLTAADIATGPAAARLLGALASSPQTLTAHHAAALLTLDALAADAAAPMSQRAVAEVAAALMSYVPVVDAFEAEGDGGRGS